MLFPIKMYIEKKAKDLYLNINNEYDRETLKNDLFGDYILRQLLNINTDVEYFSKLKDFFENQNK